MELQPVYKEPEMKVMKVLGFLVLHKRKRKHKQERPKSLLHY